MWVFFKLWGSNLSQFFRIHVKGVRLKLLVPICKREKKSIGDPWPSCLLPSKMDGWICCRKGDPFQGPKLGSCLTLRNALSEKTHVLTKQETLLGKGTQVESSRVREPRRTALPCGSKSRVLW